mgnify:CR=1 FL=1
MLKIGDVVRATELIECAGSILEGDIGVIRTVDSDSMFNYNVQFFVRRDGDNGCWWCDEEEIELVEDTTTC